MTDLEKAARAELLMIDDEFNTYGNEAMLNMFRKGAQWQAKQSPWISIEERLPQNQEIVLVKTDKNCFLTAYLHGIQSGFITYGEDAYHRCGNVTHWMKIPE